MSIRENQASGIEWLKPFRVSFSLALLFVPLLRADEAQDVLEKLRSNPLRFPPSTTITPHVLSETDESHEARLARALRYWLLGNTGRDSYKPSERTPLRRLEDVAAKPKGADGAPLELHWNPQTGTPRFLRGRPLQRALELEGTESERDHATALAFLEAHRGLLGLEDPRSELEVIRSERDGLGRRQLVFAQRYRGLPVWPSELLIELDAEGNVELLTGCHVRIPEKLVTAPVLGARAALAHARKAVPGGEEAEASEPLLVVHAWMGRMPRLAWQVSLKPSELSSWLVFVDALTGAPLNAFDRVMDANVEGSGIDARGVQRRLNVWQQGGDFFLVNTSKQMFDPSSSPPAPATTRGAIMIFDANHQGPERFSSSHITSTNANSWNLPDGVGAAFGLSETYDYYLERHGRNSLNGQGGSIIAVVRLGQNFQNAYWSFEGQFMAFGDALPYASALDVIGHELTHGVTQHSADLVYKDQPGALNEALSDIFGEMVEARTSGGPDWLKGGPVLGETLQNYANPGAVEWIPGVPHPGSMSQFIQTSEDNGGVHGNSAIINRAYYLLSTGMDGAIGLQDAEKIFYRTLITKLLRQSQFIDARLGAIASAQELFGQNSSQATKVREAFDAVEIFAAEPTQPPPPSPPINAPDATLFVFFDPQVNAYFLARRETAQDGIGVVLSDRAVHTQRPSVSGDGTVAAFIDPFRDFCTIPTDGSAPSSCAGFPNSFNSVAMAPDGQKVAVVLLEPDGRPSNKITVFDFAQNTTVSFALEAPLIDGGTVEVIQADVMDFSSDGRFLVYDALNTVRLPDFELGIWSIYALDLDTGSVITVVPPTFPYEIGSPSFSQTSDNFLTFEAFHPPTSVSTILALDLFTGQVKAVGNVPIGMFFTVPTYSGDDSAIIATVPSFTFTGASLLRFPLEADHITPAAGQPELWQDNAALGVIYRRGTPPVVQRPFRRGDTNVDGLVDISDALRTLLFLVTQGELSCKKSADTNDDGRLDLSDAVRVLEYLFQNAAAPPAPFGACGVDPTEDGLGCVRFERC